MDYIRGVTRNQVILFPESVEDYITEDNAVRFIDAFVASLDLAKLGFTRARPAETERPAYDPADLLRLYVYGYLNRVRSSRMLERGAKVNVEVMWLLGNASRGASAPLPILLPAELSEKQMGQIDARHHPNRK